jgi:hypothetical protein
MVWKWEVLGKGEELINFGIFLGRNCLWLENVDMAVIAYAYSSACAAVVVAL